MSCNLCHLALSSALWSSCRLLPVLLMDTCRPYGLWSAVVCIHRHLIWPGFLCVGLQVIYLDLSCSDMTETIHCVQIKKMLLIFSQCLLHMCTDLRDYWCATFQVNTNHTGKFTTSRDTYVPYLVM